MFECMLALAFPTDVLCLAFLFCLSCWKLNLVFDLWRTDTRSLNVLKKRRRGIVGNT